MTNRKGMINSNENNAGVCLLHVLEKDSSLRSITLAEQKMDDIDHLAHQVESLSKSKVDRAFVPSSGYLIPTVRKPAAPLDSCSRNQICSLLLVNPFEIDCCQLQWKEY